MNNLLRNRLEKYDQQISDFIQDRFYHPRLTPIMSFFSHPPFLRQIACGIILFFFVIGSAHLRWQLGFLILAIIISDQTCNLLKMVTKRIRPDGKRPAGNFWERLGSYSFPSSHTANTYCVAVFTFHWLWYLGIFFYIAATIVAISRIYLKNHYPSDVVVGAIIGIGYGILFTLLFP